MPVFFNGRLLITPQAASVVDDSALANRNLTVGNVVAIIGRSQGGEPKTAIRLRSPTQARKVLLSGDGLKAVEKAFAPSNATNGPSQVVFMRVNPAVQASLQLLDGAAAAAIDVKSTDYGLYANQIKVKVETGTNAGKKITAQLGNDYYSKDDLARSAFTIQYTGAEVTAQMSVTNTQVILKAPAATTVATIELATYDTVQELVDRLNSVAGFAATVVAGSANTASLNGLDGTTNQDVKTALYAATANLQAVIDFMNSAAEGYLTATRATNATQPPANIPFTYLAGGSDGNVTNTDWSDCLDALQTVDVQWVVPLSSDASIHAMADAHVAFMSNAGKMERRAFVGGATALTISNASDAAELLNSDRTAYCWPGIYDYDADGNLTLYPPYILAAICAGAFSGMNPGEPLTNKPLAIYGVETEIAEPTDTDYLIQSGVLAVRNTGRGFRVVKSISTWLNNQNYNRVEVSTGAAVDFVTRNVREALQEFVGRKGSPITIGQAISRTESSLRELARPEPVGPGILVGDVQNPPYRNITAELEGDVLRIQFECSPVIPINYVLATVYAVPYSTRAA